MDVSVAQEARGYSTREVRDLVGLTSARLRGYLELGLVQPDRTDGNELEFSFQDLVMLRKAESLSRELPTRKVRTALRELRRQVPDDKPLAGLQIRREADQVVVSDGDLTWQPVNGQILMDFIAEPAPSEHVIGAHQSDMAAEAEPDKAANDPPCNTAEDWLRMGCRLEQQSRFHEALSAYEKATKLTTGYIEAHRNAARIAEQLNMPQVSLRHLSTVRRLQN